MKTGKVHIWVPELIAREGGIQSYSNEMLEAISAILGPDRVTVLSKSDNQMALRIFCGEKMEVHSTGHVPAKIRTLAFSELLLRKGLTDKPDLILSTHAHFSPVGRILAERLEHRWPSARMVWRCGVCPAVLPATVCWPPTQFYRSANTPGTGS